MKKSAIGALVCLIAVVGVSPLKAQQMTDDAEHSQYILAVDEYVPAPGQFINDLPEWEEGDDAAAMAAKCTASIAGDYADDDHGMISLSAVSATSASEAIPCRARCSPMPLAVLASLVS